MSTLVINFVSNPFKDFAKSFMNTCEVIGYTRAASELRRLGYIKQSEECIAQANILRNSK